MENAFNVFALFFPENISSTFLLALQVNQIYLAIQCDFSLEFFKKGVSCISINLQKYISGSTRA